MNGEIIGICKSVRYYNEENSYSVAILKVVETKDNLRANLRNSFSITGFFPKLDVNEKVRVTGVYKNHPKYGYQMEVKTLEKLFDNSKEGLIDYFQSDLFFGIGKKAATTIVETLGTNVIDDVLKNKDILKQVPKLSDVKQDMIYRVLLENKGTQKSLVKLYEWGLTPKIAMKIMKKYESETISRVETNPYNLIDDVDGIGFLRADHIANNLGFDKRDPLRIKAVIIHVIQLVYQKYGDTYLTISQLKENVSKFIRDDEDVAYNEIIDQTITSLINTGKVVVSDEFIYLPYAYLSEVYIAKKMHEIHDESQRRYKKSNVEKAIEHVSSKLDIEYTEVQINAIHTALNSNVMILTGGPGTGKTTVIRGMLDSYKFLETINEESYKNDLLKLCAPTGRAAKRMSLASSHKAETIHKLLGYDYEGKFKFSKDNLLDANLIIIDEFSMVDTLLFYQLIQSIKPHTKIIIVGDEDQLPSVGSGQVLKDIIDSDLFPIIRLTKIHRQAEESSIIKLAHQIKNGNLSNDIMEEKEDLRMIQCQNIEVKDYILKTIEDAINRGYDLKKDIQVLIPMYKGTNGIDTINEHIQKEFNPKFPQMKEIVHGNRVFLEYDKVMQLVNQATDQIMNGDQGEITKIGSSGEVFVNFDFNVVKYAKSDLVNLKHAYAISIHKSQGSEYPLVIMPIVNNYNYMLRRNLIYTAITRAKKELIIIGDFSTFKNGIERDVLVRQTTLLKRLNEQVNLDSIKILDPTIPFDTLGEENMENITPYSFMDKSIK